MTKKNIVSIKFDSCIKSGLKNELKYVVRTKRNLAKKRILFSELTQEDRKALFDNYTMEDNYFPNIITEQIATKQLDAVIQHELLFEALQILDPKARKIILCKFWLDMTDEEIGQAMDLSRRVVLYHRNKALHNLKSIIEEMMKND